MTGPARARAAARGPRAGAQPPLHAQALMTQASVTVNASGAAAAAPSQAQPKRAAPPPPPAAGRRRSSSRCVTRSCQGLGSICAVYHLGSGSFRAAPCGSVTRPCMAWAARCHARQVPVRGSRGGLCAHPTRPCQGSGRTSRCAHNCSGPAPLPPKPDAGSRSWRVATTASRWWRTSLRSSPAAASCTCAAAARDDHDTRWGRGQPSAWAAPHAGPRARAALQARASAACRAQRIHLLPTTLASWDRRNATCV